MITMPTDLVSCHAPTASPTVPAPCPAIPTLCSVEIFAATIETPISGHVKPRLARK